MILGGGPNRIGQGIEFDYCCVHAAFACARTAYETIMVNCNPETVSTDYDTSDRLYFEPLTLEDVLEIIEKEQPRRASSCSSAARRRSSSRATSRPPACPIIGTSPDSIDLAEDRERFQEADHKLGLKQPPNRTAPRRGRRSDLAAEIGYPLVVRPSYVLGGRAMEIVYTTRRAGATSDAVSVSNESPVLLDRFLDDAIESTSMPSATARTCHRRHHGAHREAGVHSGDSACSLPPYTSAAFGAGPGSRADQGDGPRAERGRPDEHPVRHQGDDIYVLEVNPRASRTVPFVSKAVGVPLAKVAAR